MTAIITTISVKISFEFYLMNLILNLLLIEFEFKFIAFTQVFHFCLKIKNFLVITV